MFQLYSVMTICEILSPNFKYFQMIAISLKLNFFSLIIIQKEKISYGKLELNFENSKFTKNKRVY